MQTQNIFIAHPTTTEQIKVLKAIVKTFKIKFEISKVEDKAYNPEFVAKITQGDKDLQQGKGRKVTLEELNSLWK